MIDALAFVVTFHRRRYLALSSPEDPSNTIGSNSGWKPFRWTDKLEDAEKFSSEPAAKAYCEATLPGGYEIRPIYGASPRSAA